MKRARFLSVAIALAVLLALSSGFTMAQGPAPQGPGSPQATVGSTFTYQGQLKKDGNLVNDTCQMVFYLYDAVSAGNQMADPVTLTVAIADGLFTVPLDFGSDPFTGDARWLEIAVQCTGDASFNTLTPRQELTATPYALSLRPGAVISGIESDTGVLTVINGSSSGRGVFAFATAGSGTNYGVYGQAVSTDGYGVFGTAPDAGVFGWATATSGGTSGTYGRADSTAGRGVAGWATAGSGDTRGVYGRSDSSEGRGVMGYTTAISGTTYGVYGQAISTDGYGVYGYAPNIGTVGWATAASGGTSGVYGRVDSTEGRAVAGWATAGSGATRGVYGRSDSTDGVGVRGLANAASGMNHGVEGESYSASGVGVYGAANAAGCSYSGVNICYGTVGYSPSGIGAYGETTTGIGVYAYSGGSGPALRADGQVGGNLIEAWHGPMFQDRKFYVADDGNVYADGQYLNPASGFAEMLPGVAGLEIGDVLVVGPDGKLARCSTAYQPTVVGVYAPQTGFVGGAAEDTAGQVPLAVVGVVRVKVSAENGPIVPGDLLVAAATPGHAMRAGDNPALGTVIGKALGSLDKDTGTLLMLVMLR